MSFNIALVRKAIGIGLCAVVGFVGIGFGHATQASAATAKATATVLKTAKADKIITLGKEYIGVKYKFGATPGKTTSFDCSSFTQYIFGEFGIELPRVSSTQATEGVKVEKKNLKKGDLVFFRVARTGNKIGHVAVYIGNNKILHTYGSTGVTTSSINTGYWSSHYITARRVL
ncbi:NlpC/P60 family protein [Cohnella endophytica]|uniref:NlpC/P60 family protein n=1 Tax=Cohnella endophytica TaxID=2419778 RepID=A0A494Y8F0_9BACL|nr:C40 family peptidase [Cohnella endophytica]RKP56913.1 NlpC/P60 family protein [Cohnella endophytica]